MTDPRSNTASNHPQDQPRASSINLTVATPHDFCRASRSPSGELQERQKQNRPVRYYCTSSPSCLLHVFAGHVPTCLPTYVISEIHALHSSHCVLLCYACLLYDSLRYRRWGIRRYLHLACRVWSAGARSLRSRLFFSTGDGLFCKCRPSCCSPPPKKKNTHTFHIWALQIAARPVPIAW